MKKLSDPMSIEVWKIIAHQVQRISLPSRYYYDGYRVRNELEKMKQKLLKYNIEIIDGYSENGDETENKLPGLLTLLEDICQICTSINYEQAAFFEQIHKLDQIGIKTISYNPFYFPNARYNIKGTSNINQNDGIYFVKNYTDGKFSLETSKTDSEEKQTLSNFQDANYLLEYGIVSEDDNTIITSAHATIKSFKRLDLPTRAEIEKINFPNCIKTSPDRYKTEPAIYKQEFKIISADDIRDIIGFPSIREKIKYYYKNVK